MNGTDTDASATYSHLQNAIGLGFAPALRSALSVILAEQREFDELTAGIAARYGMPVGELLDLIKARAAGSQPTTISVAYGVAAELLVRQPRPEPLTDEQIAELGESLNQLLRVDADTMAKRRWQKPHRFK